MTSRRSSILMLAVAVGLAACGNYSNEDLEYMNAVPYRDDLAASMPRSNLLPTEEAELSFVTHEAITTSNNLLDLFLGIVDAVRRYQPTSRTIDSRTWGPVRAVREIGWQWRFVVIRDTPTMFTYRLEFQRVGDPPDRWSPLLTGWFEPSSGARRGVGGFLVQTSELRMVGYPFENRGDLLASVDVRYSTREFPVNVEVGIVQFVDDGTYTNTNTLSYEYATQEDGSGAMRFELSGAALIGEPTSMVDVLLVTTRWLSSGAGRGEATVTQGDAAVGLVQVQCWGPDFRQTYNNKPWNILENYGGDPSVCPEIPTL